MDTMSATRRPRRDDRLQHRPPEWGGVHMGVTTPEHSSEKVMGMGHATTITLAPTSRRSVPAALQGELFQAAERLVVAPTGGVFEPAMDLRPGRDIEVGQVVGHLNSGSTRTPIVSRFAGQSGEALAWSGERLVSHQPVMWLSTGNGAP